MKRTSGKMSPQEALYWRLWNAAKIEQGWTRLSVDEQNQKRHAVHVTALGKDKSHKLFSNSDCDKVFRAFKVLADPNNVQKRVDLNRHLNTDLGDRTRALFRIQQLAPQPYVEKLMRDRFGTTRFDDLDMVQIDQLRITLIERKKTRAHREELATLAACAVAEPSADDPY